MVRFLGIIHRAGRSSDAHELKQLREVFGDSPVSSLRFAEHIVYYQVLSCVPMATSDAIIPLEESGLLSGRLFHADSSKSGQISYDEARACAQDPARLGQRFWGRYSGCLYNAETQATTLVRDPLGLSTLFYREETDRVIFANSLRLLQQSLSKAPSLDTSYFAEYLGGQVYAPSRTPLEGIAELQPGMGLHIGRDGAIQQEHLWDVSRYAKTDPVDPKAFEQELQETLRYCLRAWFAGSSGICMELSGGLDSSALMIMLRDLFPDMPLVGVNYFDSAMPSSNEIEHAQEVATLCNAGLELFDLSESSILDPLPSSWYPDKPSTFLFSHTMIQYVMAVAQQNNCSDIINGQGGDHIFLAPFSKRALSDYWLTRGLRGSGAILSALSSENRMPWWAVMRSAAGDIAAYYGLKQSKETVAVHDYLSDACRSAALSQKPYLYAQLTHHLPGKAEQILGLYHAVTFADRNQRAPGCVMTHPYLFQPVVECALRMPTYQTYGNGYDRIALRNIANRIRPARALWRHIKGHTTASVAQTLIRNVTHVEELLRDGRLVKQDGLVNSKWLDEVLIKIRHGTEGNMWPLLRLLSAQRWINLWNNK